MVVAGCTSEPSAPEIAGSADSHETMREALRHVREHAAGHNPYLSRAYLEQARETDAQLPATATARDKLHAIHHLAKLELHHCLEREAIEHFLQAEELIASAPADLPGESIDQLLFDTAVAYLRLGETQNCCQRNAPESCILPIQGAAVHTVPEGSSQAAEYFQKVLRRTDETSPLHLTSRWLLNVAYMTLGQHPGAVPTDYLVPAESLASEQGFPRCRKDFSARKPSRLETQRKTQEKPSPLAQASDAHAAE